MRLSALRSGGRGRAALIGTCAVLVALVAIAFAVGGSGSEAPHGNTSTLAPLSSPEIGAPAPGKVVAGVPGSLPQADVAPAPALAGRTNGLGASEGFSGSSGGGVAAGGGSVAADSAASAGSDSTLGASRIVKTGNLTIRVAKTGEHGVQATAQALTSLATAQGGYVSSSNSSLDGKSPYSEVVLRVPVARFQDTIDKASAMGKVIGLNTSADDVTGKYVDLTARKHALERTRQTYLSILSRARTIGATLAVQQRIDDVQQQIDQLHGQLKLLGNQSSYSTLTVDVVPSGASLLAATHHQRHGIGKAWHDSWHRFGRGVNAIVGAIGPIVFAILLLGVLALIGFGGYRGFRRATGGHTAS